MVAYIQRLERDLEQVRRDLSAEAAAIKVFAGDSACLRPYMNMARIFPVGRCQSSVGPISRPMKQEQRLHSASTLDRHTRGALDT